MGPRHRFGRFREFRWWTLDQLAAATAYLLGPDEPMVAGETSMGRPPFWTTAYRDLAVVVTPGHVLVLRFDRYDGQPRWVALAARAPDVQVDAVGRALPTVVVRHGTGKWSIRGMAGVMRPGAVADAWKAALGVPTKTRP